MIPINPRPSEIFDLIEPVGGHKHSDGVVCVFVCYLDDSDSQLSRVATLAGYVSTLDEWKAFEVDTAPLFLCHGVDVLHAKEFHDTKGCFAGWSRIRKHSFVEELYDLVGKHVFSG